MGWKTVLSDTGGLWPLPTPIPGVSIPTERCFPDSAIRIFPEIATCQPHLALAARMAISRRLSGVRAAALRRPPILPPLRLQADFCFLLIFLAMPETILETIWGVKQIICR